MVEIGRVNVAHRTTRSDNAAAMEEAYTSQTGAEGREGKTAVFEKRQKALQRPSELRAEGTYALLHVRAKRVERAGDLLARRLHHRCDPTGFPLGKPRPLVAQT